ncbi:MAG: hypothetical protein ACK5JD_09790 [Mangrovibacterium sp.]
MAKRITNSEAAVLEQYRVSFENVKKQPVIATALAEFGYPSGRIATGQAYYIAALQVYQQNKSKDDEKLAAHNLFTQKKNALAKLYSTHRKKAKVAFRKDPITLALLAIDGGQPHVYVKWMEMVEKLYNELAKNDSLRVTLAGYKITDTELTQAATLIADTQSARAAYLLKVGESEDATKHKDAALAQIDEWMGDFYAVARIALDQHPQLLEALGVKVKS